MKPCPRCKVVHEPEWFKHLYEDWFKVYRMKGLSEERSAQEALRQVQKHTSSKPTPIPFWVKVGARITGGKEMTENVKKGWRLVDGKKTAIGAVLTFLVVVGPAAHQLAVDLGVTQQGLVWVTGGIAVVGAAHKVWKKFFGNGN